MSGHLLVFDQQMCQDYAAASSREWLEADGHGSYASSSMCGANTRRYHGLLVAAVQPPAERYVLLSKIEATLVVNGARYELSTNQYPGALHPRGFEHLRAFSLSPFPVWTFAAGGVTLTCALFVPRAETGEGTSVALIYEVTEAPADAVIELEARPLMAFRHYHSLGHENGAFNGNYEAQLTEEGSEANLRLRVKPYEHLPALELHSNAREFAPEGFWYRSFEYLEELKRGFDYHEDLYCYGALRFALNAAGGRAFIGATTAALAAPLTLAAVDVLRATETARRAALQTGTKDEAVALLVDAADKFIIRRAGAGRSVIAGYHWFADWGRDTFIALPGLMLSTRRYDDARATLHAFLDYISEGMIPNRFLDNPGANEEAEYNNVDGTLWFFLAAYNYAVSSGDYDFIAEQIYDRLVEIVEWHLRGTRYQIKVDEADGLLYAGEDGWALTWMDARVDGFIPTQRKGKCVEVNALWHAALRVMEHFATKLRRRIEADRYSEMAGRVAKSFNKGFWNAKAKCLYDVVDGEQRDGAIRPNQIFAVSLPFELLPTTKARAVVRIVEQKLLTPYGLRTLAPDDPHYAGRYEGDGRARDAVYHQGTVWPFLLGHYVTAYLRAYGRTARTLTKMQREVEPLRRHLREAGLGMISEIFDGDAPHTSRGCIGQAWSVGEALRVMVDELGELRSAGKKTKAKAARP
jgi:predicted glycogen debranching enzyme